jgi:uncharacterized protein (DUF58 family)
MNRKLNNFSNKDKKNSPMLSRSSQVPHSSKNTFLQHWKGLLRFEKDDNTSVIRLNYPWLLIVSIGMLIWYSFSFTPATAAIAAVINGLLLISYSWARHIARHTSAHRKLKYSAFQVHDELEEEITLKNTGILPIIWAQFRDNSTLPNHDITSVRASTANSSITWIAKTTCKQRGVFNLGPLTILMSDPVGIFTIEQICSQIEEVVIYPQLAKLPANILPQTRSVGDQRKLHQPLPAETINAFTTRPYVPGDPLRRLHWPRTARENELFVKIFEPESSGNVWLIPDYDAAVQCGQGSESTSEFLATLLASLSNRLLREHMSVGMFSWTDHQSIVLPRRGKPHHWNLLKAIAPLQPTDNRPMAQVIHTALTLTSARDLIIIVTPSLNTDWANLQTQNNLMTILLDPEPFSGKSGADKAAQHLQARNIPTRILHRDEIQPLRAAYGPLSRWEFLVLSTGRVIVLQKPHQKSLVQETRSMP